MVSNANYCDHMIERLELSIQSCQSIANGLSSIADGSIAEYQQYVDQLIELLRSLLDEWKEYQMILDSNTHHVSVQHTHRCGRPKFDVDQAQLEYLVSLSFNWNDIALLLGISRTTLYR